MSLPSRPSTPGSRGRLSWPVLVAIAVVAVLIVLLAAAMMSLVLRGMLLQLNEPAFLEERTISRIEPSPSRSGDRPLAIPDSGPGGVT
jgi:hypothetical protein